MKILVTGGAGFIGSHLCEALLTQGEQVVVIDNFDPFYNETIKRNNINRARQSLNYELIEGDIRNSTLVDSLFDQHRFDAVVHLAARAGVRPSIEDPVGYQDVNVNGTMVLLEAARKFKVNNFVFASSSSVYGNNKKVPFSESDFVDHPISPYAATKKTGELICYTYSHLYHINMTCLRFFTVYGPRQRPDLAIHKFAKLINSGTEIPVFGDGSMRRDFTYIDDIVGGILASISKCCGYEIYNLGESSPVRLDELIIEIETALGKKAIINHLPQQPGDVEQTYADITKAKDKLGYNPQVLIDVGMGKFIEWFKKVHK